jgi:hypothetical protein
VTARRQARSPPRSDSVDSAKCSSRICSSRHPVASRSHWEDVVVAPVGLARACPDLGHGLSLPARMRTRNASTLSATGTAAFSFSRKTSARALSPRAPTSVTRFARTAKLRVRLPASRRTFRRPRTRVDRGEARFLEQRDNVRFASVSSPEMRITRWPPASCGSEASTSALSVFAALTSRASATRSARSSLDVLLRAVATRMTELRGARSTQSRPCCADTKSVP